MLQSLLACLLGDNTHAAGVPGKGEEENKVVMEVWAPSAQSLILYYKQEPRPENEERNVKDATWEES